MKLDSTYFHAIQLKKIQMISLNCNYNERNEESIKMSEIELDIDNGGIVTSRNKGICYLKVSVGFGNKQDEPFNIQVIYKGYCECLKDVEKKDFEFYLKIQSIPMLWAYARETINNNITKMGLPPIVLPAININEIIGEITKKEGMEEE